MLSMIPILYCFIVYNAVGDTTANFPVSPGWEWASSPIKIDAGSGVTVVVLKAVKALSNTSIKTTNGTLVVEYTPLPNEQYRIAPFNEKREKIPTTSSFAFGPEELGFIVPDRIFFLGVEKITSQAFLDLTRKAAVEAANAKLQVLSYPIPGELYLFEIKDREGKAVSTESGRGKIVIIDVWTTWCLGCMKKMPELVALSEKHKDDLVIVSICRNELEIQDKALMAIDSLPKHWHYLLIPTNIQGGNSWSVAFAGAENAVFPRVVILNRKGVVDSVLNAEGLSGLHNRVEALLKTE